MKPFHLEVFLGELKTTLPNRVPAFAGMTGKRSSKNFITAVLNPSAVLLFHSAKKHLFIAR
jgi:hypothetical protein